MAHKQRDALEEIRREIEAHERKMREPDPDWDRLAEEQARLEAELDEIERQEGRSEGSDDLRARLQADHDRIEFERQFGRPREIGELRDER